MTAKFCPIIKGTSGITLCLEHKCMAWKEKMILEEIPPSVTSSNRKQFVKKGTGVFECALIPDHKMSKEHIS